MDSKSMLYGIIGLFVGAGITMYLASWAVNSGNTDMMSTMGMRGIQTPSTQPAPHGNMGMGSSMDDMMKSLDGKTGDAFDKAFLDAMIVHHEGAIDMAKIAQNGAEHAEIKTLAGEIITAQTKEIQMMRQWQTQWGY